MNRRQRRIEGAGHFALSCLTCKEIFYRGRNRGKLQAEIMASPEAKAAFALHRAKKGCPEDPVTINVEKGASTT
jgi:hypothetical protein